MAIEAEKAKERQQATQFGSDGGANIGTTAGKSRDKAAEQFGISGEQARKTVFVDEHRDLLDPADFAERHAICVWTVILCTDGSAHALDRGENDPNPPIWYAGRLRLFVESGQSGQSYKQEDADHGANAGIGS